MTSIGSTAFICSRECREHKEEKANKVKGIACLSNLLQFSLSQSIYDSYFYVFLSIDKYINDENTLARSYSLVKKNEDISMTSAFYVKVYYTKQNQQQPEIRRFAVGGFVPKNVACERIVRF